MSAKQQNPLTIYLIEVSYQNFILIAKLTDQSSVLAASV